MVNVIIIIIIITATISLRIRRQILMFTLRLVTFYHVLMIVLYVCVYLWVNTRRSENKYYWNVD